MGRPRRRGCGGGLGMRSIRPISWTRTVSWAIMGGPSRVACLDTRHPRRFLASEQVLMRFSIYDRPSASWAISHALIPIGGERRVTRSKGNVIYEIDGKPATEVLKEYLPEDALTEDRDWLRYAISLALSFRAPSYMKDEEYVVRGVPQLSLTDGSITVQTEVQEGTSIWFSSRDKEKITTGFDRMAQQIEEQLGGEQPELVFQFECVTRGQLMFREQEKLQLLKRFRQSVGPNVPWVGFYTIGEIAPVEEHNGINRFASIILALS